MASGGPDHTCFLCEDGTVVACGSNVHGQCEIPALKEGSTYTQVSAGHEHTVLLRSDGIAIALGLNHLGQCHIPALDAGVTYVQVSAGYSHTVLLCSDGTPRGCGDNVAGQSQHSMRLDAYSQVSAGAAHTVLLKQNGWVSAFGDNADGQCDLPLLREGLRYTQVSAGYAHTVLLCSDGTVIARGRNEEGQCGIPAPKEEDVMYTEVSAGGCHTVLLRSDGGAVATGSNGNGRCDIPKLVEPGMEYTQVFAGQNHTILLRSDGTAVSCGRWYFDNQWRPLSMPIKAMPPLRRADRVVHLEFDIDHCCVIRFEGERLMSWPYHHPQQEDRNIPANRLYYDLCSVMEYVARALRTQYPWFRTAQPLRIVLPGGRELWRGMFWSDLLREVLGVEPWSKRVPAASLSSAESAEAPAAKRAHTCSASDTA